MNAIEQEPQNQLNSIRKLEGVIFDFDGTIADTLGICIESFRRTVKKYTDISMSDKDVESLFGPSEAGMLKSIIKVGFEDSLRSYYKEYASLHASCTEPFDGINNLLDWLQRHKVRTAIVTGKSASAAEISLGTLGIRNRFEIVESGSMEKAIKPYSIRKVLAKWNISPSNAAYVGDAPSDVSDAIEVGVIPIAAAWAQTANVNKLLKMKPDAIFYTVDSFTRWLGKQFS